VAARADPTPPVGVRGRIVGAFSGSRELVRVAYRDPEQVAERLTLYAAQSLGEPSLAWAQGARRAHPDAAPADLAEDLRVQSAKIARIDGAIAGTPFFIALVPGYLSYLWQEARMALRTAALYGRDPRTLRTAAEVLAMRGVHPTVEAAEAALIGVRDGPAPAKPDARRPLSTWVRSVRAILVFGGFLSSPTDDDRDGRSDRLRAVLGLLIGGAIWLITWVLPLTFMIAMAWSCETHTRQLGRRVLAFYDTDASTPRSAIAAAARQRERGHSKRQALRGIALALSIAVPIGFVTYVNHVRQTVGLNWLGALGALVALSLVIATAVVGSRR
jgi:hypothetical protein